VVRYFLSGERHPRDPKRPKIAITRKFGVRKSMAEMLRELANKKPQ